MAVAIFASSCRNRGGDGSCAARAVSRFPSCISTRSEASNWGRGRCLTRVGSSKWCHGEAHRKSSTPDRDTPISGEVDTGWHRVVVIALVGLQCSEVDEVIIQLRGSGVSRSSREIDTQVRAIGGLEILEPHDVGPRPQTHEGGAATGRVLERAERAACDDGGSGHHRGGALRIPTWGRHLDRGGRRQRRIRRREGLWGRKRQLLVHAGIDQSFCGWNQTSTTTARLSPPRSASVSATGWSEMIRRGFMLPPSDSRSPGRTR